MYLIHKFQGCQFFIKQFIFTAFCLLFFANLSVAKTVKLDYIGDNPLIHVKPAKDTAPNMDVFTKFDWDVKVIYNNGNALQYSTTKPDTLKINEPGTVYLTTSFTVNPQLVNQIFTLGYTVSGSVSVKLNGITILATGSFAKDKNNELDKLTQDNYINFLFKDTLEKMEVTYTPYSNEKTLNLNLQIDQLKWAEKTSADKDRKST